MKRVLFQTVAYSRSSLACKSYIVRAASNYHITTVCSFSYTFFHLLLGHQQLFGNIILTDNNNKITTVNENEVVVNDPLTQPGSGSSAMGFRNSATGVAHLVSNGWLTTLLPLVFIKSLNHATPQSHLKGLSEKLYKKGGALLVPLFDAFSLIKFVIILKRLMGLVVLFSMNSLENSLGKRKSFFLYF